MYRARTEGWMYGWQNSTMPARCCGSDAWAVVVMICRAISWITPDGGCVLALATNGNDGDVSGNHNPGRYDYWIVKLDNAGAIGWQQCLGGTDDDMAQTITVTPGGICYCR